MVITAKCAHCGAQIVFSQNAEAVLCKYCDSVNVVPKTVPVSTPSSEAIPTNDVITQEIELVELMPQVTYEGVRYRVGTEELMNGSLLISENELCFKPAQNVLFKVDKEKGLTEDDIALRYVHLSQINECTATKYMLTLYTKSNVKIEFVIMPTTCASKAEDIANDINKRRSRCSKSIVQNSPSENYVEDNSPSTAKPENKGKKEFENIKDTPLKSLLSKCIIGVAVLWILLDMLKCCS